MIPDAIVNQPRISVMKFGVTQKAIQLFKLDYTDVGGDHLLLGVYLKGLMQQHFCLTHLIIFAEQIRFLILNLHANTTIPDENHLTGHLVN